MTKTLVALSVTFVLLGSLLHAQARPTSAPASARPIKMLVLHDMEGLSGQDDWRTFSHAYPELYAKGRQLLVNDVNAVIAGLYDGGATTVDVVDGHGSGNTEPDLPLELLDPRARMTFRNHPFDPYVDLVAPGAYDAVALVGMHAKPGSRGFASHTGTLGMVWMLNGMSVSEPEVIGYSWGRVGVPIVFVAGDDRLQGDLQSSMPGIEFVVTKIATSASTVQLRSVDSVHAEMRAGARRAVQNVERVRPLKLETPILAGLRATPPASLTMLDSVPGLAYRENSVTFTAQNFGEAYRGINALIRVAVGGYQSVLNEVLASEANAQQLQLKLREALFARWQDYESGRWTPPPPSRRPRGGITEIIEAEHYP